jgi:tRNA/rRNA methyltransferase
VPTADLLSRIRIVLVAPSHPGNIGAAARAMFTMGITRLVVVAPRRFPDPEASALASGAGVVLDDARVVPTLEEAIQGAVLAIGLSARPRAFAGRVLTVRDAATEAIATAAHGDIAFVFGTEMSGLSNAELARCAIVATIPANSAYASLNLAAAVQVVAYELRVAATGGTVWRAPRLRPRQPTRSGRCSRAASGRWSRCVCWIPACRSASFRRSGGSSPAPAWKRKRSTSCGESSRASISSSRARNVDRLAFPARFPYLSPMEEPAAADPALPPCRNCGAPAPGAYCPACGQETRTRPPTFIQFMREAGGRYVALDGRLWRTLGALLFRPGFLTREYFAGRRRRYIRPARLFLVASLLLFAALRIVVELGDFDVVHFDPPAKTKAPAKESGNESGNESAKESGKESGLTLDDDFNVAMFDVQIPAIRKRVDRFNHLSNQEKAAQMTEGVLRYGPYAMFVLLPAFALLLKILYLGPRRRHPTRPRLMRSTSSSRRTTTPSCSSRSSRQPRSRSALCGAR